MTRHIALLRGINVGGHRRVSMPELRELLTGLGYGDVRTLLQSGNVVLTSKRPPDGLARELEQQIAEGLGVDPRVVVRTRDELADVIERDPFGGVATEPRHHQVWFLSGEPDPGRVAEVAEAARDGEQLVASGREIYTWHPGGFGRSKLAAALAARDLGAVATARNWNTVTRLLELADDRRAS
jgi:uncharacterized protein (DUF1697 family)